MIGLGIGENFVASGVPALLPVTQRFIYLEQGDLAEITRDAVKIYDAQGQPVTRAVHETQWSQEAAEKGPYRHFMLKEIFEQPSALADTLYGRVVNHRVVPESLGMRAAELLPKVNQRAHRGLRHELPRRLRGPLLARIDRRRAVPGGDCERVPLPQRRRAARHAVPHAVAVGRDRRHARGATHGEDGGLSRLAHRVQQRAQLHGARERPRHDDAGRPRDRRGQHEGVHHAAALAAARDADARPPPRHDRGARSRVRSASVSRRRGRGAGARDERATSSCSPRTSPRSSTRCSWGAARCGRSRWKAR